MIVGLHKCLRTLIKFSNCCLTCAINLFIFSSFSRLLQNKQVSLWSCYMKSCWRMFVVSGVFKLFGDLCGLVGPLSISYIVEFINLQLSNAPQQPTSAAAPGAISHDAIKPNNFRNETNADSELLMKNYPSWSEFIGNGWIVSCIVLIAFLLQGTFSQASTNLINMEGLKIKNALQGLIYRKTLSLSASCFSAKSKRGKNKVNERTTPSTL